MSDENPSNTPDTAGAPAERELGVELTLEQRRAPSRRHLGQPGGRTARYHR